MVEFAKGQGFVASDDDVAVAVGLKKGNPDRDKINEILAKISDEQRKALWIQLLKTSLCQITR
jgi:putative lysine transport system permease protein